MENPLLWGLDHLQEIKTWQCQIRQRNAGWLMCGVSTGRLSPVSPLGPQRDISFNWGADCTSPAALVSASQMHTAASHSSGKSSDKGLLTLHATGTGKRKKKNLFFSKTIFSMNEKLKWGSRIRQDPKQCWGWWLCCTPHALKHWTLISMCSAGTETPPWTCRVKISLLKGPVPSPLWWLITLTYISAIL